MSSPSGLTPKQERFVREYQIDLNAGAAYKRAGYAVKNDNAAWVGASVLLRNAKVASAIAKAKTAKAAKLDIKADRILLELARIGFSDPRRFFNPDGSLKDMQALSDDEAACIASVEVFEQYIGKGKDRKLVGHVKKIKFWPKNSACELLGKHVGLFPDRPSATVNVNVENLTDEERISRLRQLAERVRAARGVGTGTPEGVGKPVLLPAEPGPGTDAGRPVDDPADGPGGTGPVAGEGTEQPLFPDDASLQ